MHKIYLLGIMVKIYPKKQLRTRIGRIFTYTSNPRVSALSVQSVLYHICCSLKRGYGIPEEFELEEKIIDLELNIISMSEK